MNKYKYIDYIGYMLILTLFLAIVFLFFKQIPFFKSMIMLQPFFWLLTLYFSMVFYYFWYIEEKNKLKDEDDFILNLKMKKKLYRIYGISFGVLLLISILLN